MDKNLLDLYSDYLLSSFGATTATGLSAALQSATERTADGAPTCSSVHLRQA